MAILDLDLGTSDLEQLRLLVVTADETLYAGVRRACSTAQLPVRAVENGQALLSAREVDALVLDLDHADSLTVCERVRSSPELSHLSILAVAGRDRLDVREAAVRAGVDELLSRPFDELELKVRLRSLARASRRHRHRGQNRELALFRAAIDQCADAIHVIDPPSGRFLCVNATAHQRLGYSYEEYIKMRACDVEAELPTEAQWTAHVDELRTAGELTFAGVHRRRDGLTFPVEVNVRYIEAEPKDYMVAISRDVSDRRVSETALRLTQFTVDRAVDSIFWVGPNAQILYVNDKACETLGYSREEMLRSTVHDIDPNFPKEVWPAHWEELKQRGSFSFESLHARKHGPPIHTETTVNYLQFDGHEYNCAIMRDITDRKQIEEARRASEMELRQTQSQLEATLAAIPDLLFEIDLAGTYRFVRAAKQSLLAAPLSELLGKRVQDVLPEKASRAVLAAMHEANEHGFASGTTYELDLPVGKSTFELSVAKKPGHADELPRFVLLARDVTKRLQLESEREKLEEQLLQSEKMNAIGLLAGSIAHDFNNMLGVILIAAEDARTSQDDRAGLSARLDAIEMAAKRSSLLTKQLLAFARKQPAAPEDLNLNSSLSPSVTMLERLMGEEVTLLWAPAAERCNARIDPSQLDQILTNLTLNARDSIRGSGTITISTACAMLDATAVERHAPVMPGRFVVLSVEDTGCGIDPAVKPHIFEPFFTTKARNHGTGLGLSMVHGIAAQNGGFVEVDSEVGRGSTFRVYLPCTALGNVKISAPPPPMVAPRFEQETVLLVEDEPALLSLTKRMLERIGHKVLAAGGAREALRLAEQHRADITILISDVVLPGMNGIELQRLIADLCPHILSLFVSGYPMDALADKGMAGEQVQLLSKPFTRADLSSKLSELRGTSACAMHS